MVHHEQLWKQHFPEFLQSGDPEVVRLVGSAQLIRLPAGHTVFYPGSPCDNYVLVVEGGIRTQLIAENGREVVLYYVRAGDSCVLTTSCLLGNQRYPAEGVTEQAVSAFVMGHRDFQRALDRSSIFRRFVFDNFARRLATVIGRMEEVVFDPIDRRLARMLLASNTLRVAATHHDLAVKLGTVREVVSRNLKRFEHYGWVSLARGAIDIVDREALQRLAALREPRSL